MAQSISQKAVNNFVKGLITEASELTFPEGASVDESNCDLRRDGTRRRRLNVEYESSHALSSFTLSNSEAVATGEWTNAGGDANRDLLVLQKGSNLYFYNKASTPYSNQLVTSFSFNGLFGTTIDPTVACQFTTIKGMLVVTSSAMQAIRLIYNSNNTVSGQSITFEVRDFEWQGYEAAGDEYFFEKSIIGNLPSLAANGPRLYDAYNSGWGSVNNGIASVLAGNDAFTTHIVQSGNILQPPLTHPWFSGKDSSNVQNRAEFLKIDAGKTLTANGRFVLNFFNKQRTAAYNTEPRKLYALNGVSDETESSRFQTCETFSGRVFYAGLTSAKNAGTILFSRIVEDANELGECFQRNDPTSENLSDLLDNDGGVIEIPDAYNIQKLYGFQGALFVFAENGVWQIQGVDGVFRATEFSVNQVSKVGILHQGTFVQADGVPFWWSKYGIHTLQADAVTGSSSQQNITIPTIQTFWNEITDAQKAKVIACYDNVNKRLYWGYPNAGEGVASKINNFLILDIPLQAFFPWKISDEASSTDAIVGLAYYDTYAQSEGDPSIVLICRDGATNKITMGHFSGVAFLDWGSANYTSFAETGYDFIGDAVLKKNAPFIVTYARVTETGFTGNETDGYTAVRPSGLTVAAAWDFREDFQTAQEVYRLKYPLFPNSGNLNDFNYPDDVITSRIKIRGHGRSMRIKYESVQGKDFILLGWGMLQGRNPRY
tara:strand:+ start:507 stop:2654 length:2148 start_codon:yes stop_codon:yes gene_type:complete